MPRTGAKTKIRKNNTLKAAQHLRYLPTLEALVEVRNRLFFHLFCRLFFLRRIYFTHGFSSDEFLFIDFETRTSIHGFFFYRTFVTDVCPASSATLLVPPCLSFVWFSLYVQSSRAVLGIFVALCVAVVELVSQDSRTPVTTPTS